MNNLEIKGVIDIIELMVLYLFITFIFIMIGIVWIYTYWNEDDLWILTDMQWLCFRRYSFAVFCLHHVKWSNIYIIASIKYK